MAPSGMVKVYPRRIDLENTEQAEKLRRRRRWSKPCAELETSARRARCRMAERLVFLTGHLAEPRLKRVLDGLGETEFAGEIARHRRQGRGADDRGDHPAPADATRCRPTASSCPGAAAATSTASRGISACRSCAAPTRSPTCRPILGRGGEPPDLSRHDMRIFAEIVDAPMLAVEAIVERGTALRRRGRRRDRPRLPAGHAVSAPRRGGRGAEGGGLRGQRRFGRSRRARPRRARRRGLPAQPRRGDALDLAVEVAAMPVLIPALPGDLDSLGRAIEQAGGAGHRHSSPIRCSIRSISASSNSLARYASAAALARGRDADGHRQPHRADRRRQSPASRRCWSASARNLRIRNVLVVQVSPHTRRTVEEHDAARRASCLRRAQRRQPARTATAMRCCALHDRSLSRARLEEIAALAAAVRDANFRIEVAAGRHPRLQPRRPPRRRRMRCRSLPSLGVEKDGAHAFYLGAELVKAEIAWRLGKRYAQDEPLDWGVRRRPPGGGRPDAPQGRRATRCARRQERLT